jgi:hypothetical protein
MTRDQQRLIESFNQVLKTLPDDRAGINTAIDFLSSISRTRHFIPPTAEMVTVLKRQKPILFQFLKKSIASSSPLYFVIHLDMDYDVALSRLQLTEKKDPTS